MKFFIRKITLTASSSGLFEEYKLLPGHLDIFEIVPKRERQTSVSEALCEKKGRHGRGRKNIKKLLRKVDMRNKIQYVEKSYKKRRDRNNGIKNKSRYAYMIQNSQVQLSLFIIFSSYKFNTFSTGKHLNFICL